MSGVQERAAHRLAMRSPYVGLQRAGELVSRALRSVVKASYWAWLDIVCQYRRSYIGPLWETINVLVMTLGITVVSSAVIGGNATDLIAYIGLGIVIWSLITSLILEGATNFTRNALYITSSNIGIAVLVGRSVFKAFIIFAHHFALYFVALALSLVQLSMAVLLAPVGLFLLFLNGIWIVTLFGLLVARFRDIELILRNLLQVAFFVTPVFWDYRLIAADRRFLIDYNVLYYYVEIVRRPLLGSIPPLHYYIVVIAMTVVGFAVALATYYRMRRSLAFFV